MGGYLKSKGEPGDASFVDVELDFNICGPFTAADPTCASGTVVHEELTAYDAGGWDQSVAPRG